MQVGAGAGAMIIVSEVGATAHAAAAAARCSLPDGACLLPQTQGRSLNLIAYTENVCTMMKSGKSIEARNNHKLHLDIGILKEYCISIPFRFRFQCAPHLVSTISSFATKKLASTYPMSCCCITWPNDTTSQISL